MSHAFEEVIITDDGEEMRLNEEGGGMLNMENEKRMRREIANSNERRRMQSINAGFQSLRSLLPHHEVQDNGYGVKSVKHFENSSATRRAEITFSVARVRRNMRNGRYSKRIGVIGYVYAATVLEYLVTELLELAGNEAIRDKHARITPRNIMFAIRKDEEFLHLMDKVTIPDAGVVPNVHPALLNKAKNIRYPLVFLELSYFSPKCKICKKKCPELSECSTFKSFNLKQKWDAVNNNKLCRKCLRSHNGYCRLTKECGVDGCLFKHHPTLHNDQKQQKTNSNPKQNSNATNASVVSNNFHGTSMPNILFRIVPVTLYNNNKAIKTLAYIDEGSSGTLLEEELASELNIIGNPERLCLLWTNNVHRIEENSSRMNLVISGQDDFNVRYKMKGVRSVKFLGLPAQTINQSELVKRFCYLEGIPLINYENEKPRILIGLPHANLCTQLITIEGNEHQPIASKSRIGWSLHGPTREQQFHYVQSTHPKK
ncbi:Histone H2A.1 [Pseudolycoriella hygida]|uniref:Histone H2A.1 n=1 Tax=Pseudolycoriella hygida TaxID=35572 RepID=A0A9Q0S818_9DIPT|nr:Histone H2A.1 [Pseudolycoriella hygida]